MLIKIGLNSFTTQNVVKSAFQVIEEISFSLPKHILIPDSYSAITPYFTMGHTPIYKSVLMYGRWLAAGWLDGWMLKTIFNSGFIH